MDRFGLHTVVGLLHCGNVASPAVSVILEAKLLFVVGITHMTTVFCARCSTTSRIHDAAFKQLWCAKQLTNSYDIGHITNPLSDYAYRMLRR